MIDKLHQINVTYSAREDRLLLKVATLKGDEYRIWMTRRFTGLLFNVLNKEMDKHGGIANIGTDEETRKLFKAGAFEKSFEHENTTGYPLGEQGILAYGIKTTVSNEGNLVLEILPEKGAGVTINLNKPHLYMLHNLLSQGVGRAEWQSAISQDTLSIQVH